MSTLRDTIRDLVVANRILAHENVVDAYGHISVRNPDNPNTYFISVSRSPELVKESDIVECALDGTPVGAERRALYIERHIHGAIYEKRPEVQSVIHSHALEVLPFSISTTPMEPVLHSAGIIGRRIHVWDIRDRFGDTSLLVENMAQGRDLADRLADDRVVLMRGHGFATGRRGAHRRHPAAQRPGADGRAPARRRRQGIERGRDRHPPALPRRRPRILSRLGILGDAGGLREHAASPRLGATRAGEAQGRGEKEAALEHDLLTLKRILSFAGSLRIPVA